jgi:hypothetical protein
MLTVTIDVKPCALCGASNPASADFCEHCGTSFDPTLVNIRELYDLPLIGSDRTARVAYVNEDHLTFYVVKAQEQIDVPLQPKILIGRSDGTGILPALDLRPYEVDRMGVSRHHALIQRVQHQFTVMDLDSRFGTYLNDRKLMPYQEHGLRNGDLLRLGFFLMYVYFA